MLSFLKNIFNESLKHVNLKEDDVILDIGANDGTLLNFYKSKIIIVISSVIGVAVTFCVGVDIASICSKRGVAKDYSPFLNAAFHPNEYGLLGNMFVFCDDVGIVNGQFCIYLVRSKYESFILANFPLINDPCSKTILNVIFIFISTG